MQPLCIAPLSDSYVTYNEMYQMSHVFKLATILLGCICTQNFTNAIGFLDSADCHCKAACTEHFHYNLAGTVASQTSTSMAASSFVIRKQAHSVARCLLQNGCHLRTLVSKLKQIQVPLNAHHVEAAAWCIL